jgi:hypothetical protein
VAEPAVNDESDDFAAIPRLSTRQLRAVSASCQRWLEGDLSNCLTQVLMQHTNRKKILRLAFSLYTARIRGARMKFPEGRSDEFRQNTKLCSNSWVPKFLGLACFTFGSISLASAQQSTRGSAAQPPVAQAPATEDAKTDATKFTTPQTPQQKQLAEDTAKLLTLANELKAEIDKSNKDTLSLGVIKKAEQVEKLAHKVRDEMKAGLQN